MFTTGFTAAGSNDKANEDWFLALPNLAIVLDGATVRLETGCQHDVPWYAQHLGAFLVPNAADAARSLTDALKNAIAQVSDLHRGTCDLADPGTPSAAVGIVRHVNGTFEYLVLGDVSLVIEFTKGDDEYPLEIISDPRVSETAADERLEVDRHPIGSTAKAEALIPMKLAELAARNTEGGYWIAAADPAAAEHALVGSFPEREVVRLALLSDGAARLIDTFDMYAQHGGWTRVLNMLESDGPAALVARVRAAEDADPVGAAHPRNKVSDDATILYADFHKEPSSWTGPREGRTINFTVDFDDPEVQKARAKGIAQLGAIIDNPQLTGADVKAFKTRQGTQS